MSSYIDVKFRVDGINVMRKDCLWKMKYGVESYPNYDEGYSVLVDVKTDDMVKLLESKGYEVNGQYLFDSKGNVKPEWVNHMKGSG